MGMAGIKNIMNILQRIGNIKMGFKGKEHKKQGGGTFRLPQKLEYFLITTMDRDPDTNDWIVDKDLMDKFGEKPKALSVYVPYDNIDLIFPREYARWSGSMRHCQGNGEVALRTDEAGAEPVQIKCPCDKLDNECKPHGILSVILEGSGRIGGVHQLRTTSHNTIRNIVTSLNLLKSLTGGPLAGLPLTLTIMPMKVHPKTKPGGKAPGQVTIYVAGLEYRADTALDVSPIKQLQEAAQGQVQARLSTGQDMKQLEEAVSRLDIDTIMDAMDWEEEFTDTAGEEGQVDSKTDAKADGLKQRMTKSMEKKAGQTEGKQTKPKTTTKKGKPTVAEQKAILRADLESLLDEIDKLMPKTEVAKWSKWLNGDQSVYHLKEGLTALTKKKAEYKNAGKPQSESKKGRPSLKDLTTQLTELLDSGFTENLVTDDEVKAVGADALKNQKAKWLNEQITEWTEVIAARRAVRDEESNGTDVSDSGTESGQQNLL